MTADLFSALFYGALAWLMVLVVWTLVDLAGWLK
jgi:hypothetical protein